MEKEKKKTLTLVVCFLLLLKGERKKCLTLAAYFLRLEIPGLPACYQLFPPFLLGELCCLGKGVLCLFHKYFLLLRGMFPKLLRQHILLTLI